MKNKISGLIPNTSITILGGQNAFFKRQRLAKWIKICHPTI